MRSANRKGTGKHPEYLEWIRGLPCVVCEHYEGVTQRSMSEAAHVGEHRGLSQKCDDYETIPLCGMAHHREGPTSHHKLGRRFFSYHELNRSAVISELLARYWRYSQDYPPIAPHAERRQSES